jgi:iron complex transport system permease protein
MEVAAQPRGSASRPEDIFARRSAAGVAEAPAWRAVCLLLAVVLLVLVCWASVAVGAKPIPLGTVVDALFGYDATLADHLIVRDLRVPRTEVGLLVGVALGLSGAVMQGVSRNPLADPGILGISAGASFMVVLAIHALGIGSAYGYVWFAFAGAAAAALAVYAVGSLGREGATPIKLCLAGAAVTTLLGSFTTAILLLDVSTMDQFRFWAVGSLAGRDAEIAASLAPFIVAGALAALACGPALNALALGDDLARGLGQRVGRARAACVAAVVVLCGAATAAAGPIVFVGLVIPYAARFVTGPDYRWILPFSMVLAPVFVLGADILGRVLIRPAELQVGIVTAALGAPFFVWLVRRRNLAEL